MQGGKATDGPDLARAEGLPRDIPVIVDLSTKGWLKLDDSIIARYPREQI